MEQTSNQEAIRKIFSQLVADPSAHSSESSAILTEYLEKYPYSQLLRAFNTAAVSRESAEVFERELFKTALSVPDRGILRKIIERPEELAGGVEHYIRLDSPAEEAIAIETASVEQESMAEENHTEVEEVYPESSEAVFTPGEINEPDIPTIDPGEREEATTSADHIITEDPGLSGEDPPGQEVDEEAARDVDAAEDIASISLEAATPEPVFVPEGYAIEAEEDPQEQQSHEEVSKYDDDRMPYSFLWWLNKTRKEHSDTYQPYVSFQLDTNDTIREAVPPIRRNQVDPLSSQIIENIFHLQSPVDQSMNNPPRTVPFQVRRKEDEILEKFIREEPQIKPPNSEKIDTENKARKSSEDSNDLVSETLAQIYTDQMLYHKAIETYRKLSLKFPEKSAYFADQIRELEKKVN